MLEFIIPGEGSGKLHVKTSMFSKAFFVRNVMSCEIL